MATLVPDLPSLFFLDLLKVPVDGAFRTGIAEFLPDCVDRRISPRSQEYSPSSDHLRLVEAASRHDYPHVFRTVLHTTFLHTIHRVKRSDKTPTHHIG